MKSNKEQYSQYLSGVRKRPFFNPEKKLNHQRNNTAAFNPLSSQRDPQEELIQQETFKPGSIVEKVKDELNKTIHAKRRLLERNFIHFRFDEFKKGKQQIVQELEEIERKKASKSPQKGMEGHPIKTGMWKSIEVYTPKHVAHFQNLMTLQHH